MPGGLLLLLFLVPLGQPVYASTADTVQIVQ
jgi:hypothetical protein